MDFSRYTVVFDLDGTLVHTAPDIARALNAALMPLGVHELSIAETETLIGDGLHAAFERALELRSAEISADGRTNAREVFLSAYAAAPAERSRAYPDIPDLIEALHARGARLAAIEILSKLGLAHAFKAIVGSVPGRERKPSAVPILEAIRLAGGNPQLALMIGDSAADAQAALAADILAILIKHGYSQVPVDTLGADLCVADARELRLVLMDYFAAKSQQSTGRQPSSKVRLGT
jgi:phosphoglycolate phosphatase